MNSIRLSILLACIIALSLFSKPLIAQNKTFTVISYNVLEGFRNDSTLKTKFVNWINPKAPDLVFFQEMNKFTQKSLEELALRYGHPYAVLSKVTGYPVAVTSKYPIVNVQKVLESMHHGYISANVNGINVFAIHLSPHNAEKRHREADQILYQASLLPKNSKVIIAGDFNSYSVHDSDLYTPAYLEEAKATEVEKPYVHNLINGEFDFYIPKSIENAGLIDSFWKLHGREARSYKRRIDYVFVSKNLAKTVIKSDFIRDDVTKMLSDHLPMYVQFNFK